MPHTVEHHRHPTPLPSTLLVGHLTVGYPILLLSLAEVSDDFFSVERLNKKCFLTSLGEEGKGRSGRGRAAASLGFKKCYSKKILARHLCVYLRAQQQRCGKLLPRPFTRTAAPCGKLCIFCGTLLALRVCVSVCQCVPVCMACMSCGI